MKVRYLRLLAILLVVLMVMVACGGEAEETTAPEEPPAAEEEAVVEEPEVEEVEAATTNIVHYYSGELGRKDMQEIIDAYNASQTACNVVDNTTGHEDFKTQILVMLAGENPPDIFSYWAGARVQFVVDAGRLMELSDYWNENDLDAKILPGIQGASNYSGGIYAVPQNYHFTGLFYNPKVFEAAGITELPETWDEMMVVAEKLKENGVYPFALGSKERWPAQFWFDFLVSYTAGHEYRAKLQAGEASFTDPEVQAAMELWKELVEKEYFYPDANAYVWTDAADQVANGQAAMHLMGTWTTGYWNDNGLVPGEDYDLLPFPVIDSSIPIATFGPVDAWAIPSDAAQAECALDLLNWFLTPEMQEKWAVGQGALAATTDVDPTIYNVVMAKANDLINSGTMWIPAYDLSTPPPNAEVGLNMFAQFMDDPANYMQWLEEAQTASEAAFAELNP
jgi:multiple sugar transport system substrate-binding protein/raffinose/stachyose/melibiose transport system substrate-binding protein